MQPGGIIHCCFRILTRFYPFYIESFLRLASHRSYVVILLLSVVRLQYFCHWIRKFSEIVKIESSLRGDDLSRKGLASETRALAFLRDSITINERATCPMWIVLAQCARVGDSVLNKFSVQHCRAGHCPRPICANSAASSIRLFHSPSSIPCRSHPPFISRDMYCISLKK